MTFLIIPSLNLRLSRSSYLRSSLLLRRHQDLYVVIFIVDQLIETFGNHILQANSTCNHGLSALEFAYTM